MSAEQQLADLRKTYAGLLEERNKLRMGLRRMHDVAVYYIGAREYCVKEHMHGDPDINTRLASIITETTRVKHIMKACGLDE